MVSGRAACGPTGTVQFTPTATPTCKLSGVCVCVCAVVAEDLRALRFTAGDWVKETWQTVATSSLGHRRRRQLCTAFVIVQIHVIAQCVSSCMLDLCQWWANLESNINAKSRILYTDGFRSLSRISKFHDLLKKNKTYIISNIYHRLKTVNNIRVVTLISSRNQVSTLSQFRMYCFSYKKHGLDSFDSQFGLHCDLKFVTISHWIAINFKSNPNQSNPVPSNQISLFQALGP